MIYAENILICIIVPLVITIMFIKGNARRLIIFFVSGMAICLLTAYMGGFLEYALDINPEETSIFISPVTEEIMKLLPILFYLILFEPSDNELVHAATGIGAGFATFENCCYILTAGTQSLRHILIRGLAVGVMHVMSILALTLALIMLRRRDAFTVPVLLGGLGISVSLHSLYNLLVSVSGIPSYTGYCIPLCVALVISMFWDKIMRKSGSRGEAYEISAR